MKRHLIVATVVLMTAYVIGITQSSFVLQSFYAIIAMTVFVMGFRANSLMFLFLGTLLFVRFFLENYQYAWSPIGQLAFGHFALSVIVFLIVRRAKNIWLMYFPALIFLQGLCDVSYLMFEYDMSSYVYPHNALALMQMSAFVVLAYERRKTPVFKDDPIEELISRLTRNWASVLQPWKSNSTV